MAHRLALPLSLSLPRSLRPLLLALVLAGALMLPHTQAPKSVEAAGVRSYAASVALSYVGYRYAWIGDTPWTGFSCVGLVHWAYQQIGLYAPENTHSLWAGYRHLPWSQVQPGDILLFQNTVWPGLSHAAIYIGNGLMVGADNFQWGVHVDRVWDSYWGPRYVTAVRP